MSNCQAHGVVSEENVAPLVVHQEEEGEDGGEEDQDDADHHHQAAVKQPAEKTGLLAFPPRVDDDHCNCSYNYNGLFYISIFLMLITRGS